ncbi:hypothetical protein FHW69_001138 [Luteibacter sp. Sphag1AF]|uniref:hypothetical protein n=1 Tax=Luteibacter sp. Sphag1AF TaxID=2587031 RepID=UPI00161CCC65|nr:hypothetical protein [Luteibacter sp. Sphag1AF]MBB3226548.1 hypothetical protein [Luteibacter sp. Sphag1AF]
MPDTIELLEAIGRDASLRHASPAALSILLDEAHASGTLTRAVASGDTSELAREFRASDTFVPQSIQTFFIEF